MLVTEVFRRVNRLVSGAMILSGLVLGMVIAYAFNRESFTLQWLAVLYAASLAIGYIAALGILGAYRKVFSVRVPLSKATDIISPQNFGKVAKRHFTNFAKALFASVVMVLLSLAYKKAF